MLGSICQIFKDMRVKALFKGKQKGSSEWVEGGIHDNSIIDGILGSTSAHSTMVGDCIEVDPWTISQLVTKVGEFKIWEGMTVHKDYNDGDGFQKIGRVVFCNTLLAWTVTDGDKTDTLSEYVEELKNEDTKEYIKFT